MISQKWCEFGFVCLAFNEEKSVNDNILSLFPVK